MKKNSGDQILLLIKRLDEVGSRSQIAKANKYYFEALTLILLFIMGKLKLLVWLKGKNIRSSNEFDKQSAEVQRLLLNLDQLSEKELFRISLMLSLIDDKTFKALNDLFNKRNEIIHRYLSSEIKYEEILSLIEIGEEIIPILEGEIDSYFKT